MNRSTAVVVASFPRSGTHLIIDFLRRNFVSCRLPRYPLQYLELSFVDLDRISKHSTWPYTVAKTQRRLGLAKYPVCKTHSPADASFFESDAKEVAEAVFTRAKVIHVVRDPRKVFCSYQLMREERPALRESDLISFLETNDEMFDCSVLDAYEKHCRSWAELAAADSERVLLLRYEDVVKQPEETLMKVESFLGERRTPQKKLLPPKMVSKWQRRYFRAFQFSPDSTAVLGRGDGGLPAVWDEVVGPKAEQLLRARLSTVMALGNY